jgi:lysophospholipase L1-like esterase
MPLGDSLTNGFTVPGGYRIELEDRLIAGRFDFNFVGSLSNGPTDLEARQHEGHNGYRIDEIAAGAQTWLTSTNPMFVLLMIGTNDVTQDYQLATAPDRLSALIDQILTTLPSSNVLVASIPPLSDPDANAKANQYNAAIPGIVSAKQAQGKSVTFVDVNAALTTADLADGVHLTAPGYAKVGATWFDALRTLLPARGPPPSFTCPCSIWSDATVPKIKQVSTQTNPHELGVKFRSDLDGYVTGIRFYKGPDNTGIHVGHLWTRTGTLLATATFTGETATGWQQVTFDTPVAIIADTTYVASYYAPVGRFAKDDPYFKDTEAFSYPLRALAWGMSGPNGVYRFGSSGFPQTFAGYANYWVDVVFMPVQSPQPPPTPTGVSASAVSASRIDVSWSDVAGETGYRLERSADGSTGWTTIATPNQDVTSYSDTGLSTGTTYYYRVIASNAGGDSAPSAVVSATTLAGQDTIAPTAPANLKATGAKRKINLGWTGSSDAGGSGLAGYEVWRATTSTGPFAHIATTNASTASFSDASALSGTTYWYYVLAFDGAGNKSQTSNIANARAK